MHLETVDFDYDVYLGDGEVDSRSRPGPWCAAKEIELNPLQTKCDTWAALPTGGVSAYFARQANYATGQAEQVTQLAKGALLYVKFDDTKELLRTVRAKRPVQQRKGKPVRSCMNCRMCPGWALDRKICPSFCYQYSHTELPVA